MTHGSDVARRAPRACGNHKDDSGGNPQNEYIKFLYLQMDIGQWMEELSNNILLLGNSLQNADK